MAAPYRLVLPKPLVTVVLRLFHDSAMGAHGGINDTVEKIKHYYFFPKMATVIAEYVRSCDKCQTRKVSKFQGKNKIVSYKTPTGPFSVWEVDLYGPIPCTNRGNTYIFTALDMFSRFIFAVPIPNKDAHTVSEAIFQLVTTFGVCETLISDQGSEFMARVTQELCKILDIPQQFTPSFVHHCVGACERSHATLATKLTPYMTPTCNNWDSILPSVVFAMNCSVNATTGHSPFEVVYGRQPQFPLTSLTCADEPVPQNVSSYLLSKRNILQKIQDEIREHMAKANLAMTERLNKDRPMLIVTKGDYVYMTDENPGTAKKLKPLYSGPYVVDSVVSDHMVRLTDPGGKKTFSQPIHIDRLKPAYVRQPNPSTFFKVSTKRTFTTCSTQTQQLSVPQPSNSLVESTQPLQNAGSGSGPNSDESPSSSVSADESSLPVFSRPRRTISNVS